MNCPICGQPGRVIESRAVDSPRPAVRRRRTCARGHRFSSWESTEFPFVMKRDGMVAVYRESNVRQGIEKALEGLMVDSLAVDDLVTRLGERVAKEPEVSSRPLTTLELGEEVLDGLRELDPTEVAYFRFASVFLKHAEWTNLEELLDLIRVRLDRMRIWVEKAADPLDEGSEIMLELFNPSKLRRSVEVALTDRMLPAEETRKLVGQLLDEVRGRAELRADGREQKKLVIGSRAIGEIVLQRLQAIDLLAYARFASVHLSHESIEDFLREVSDAAGIALGAQ